MSFEQAYDRYVNGTATDEERAFVEEEIAKAKKLTEIIDAGQVKRVTGEADMAKIKKVKKQYSIERALRTAIIVIMLLVLTGGAVCGGVFGTAVTNAKANMHVTAEQAQTIAIQYVTDNYITGTGPVLVTDIERELYVGNVKNAVYNYSVEVQNGVSNEIELEINAHTGKVTLIEID